VGGGPLDAGGDALERHGQVLDAGDRQLLQQLPQRLVGVQVGAGAGQRPDPPEQRAAERLAGGALAPHPVQPRQRRRRVGVGGDEDAVERPDRGPQDQVRPDPGLGERLQHADLVGAQHPSAAEHEGDLVRSLVRHGPSPGSPDGNAS
jgi:hypothetical protein